MKNEENQKYIKLGVTGVAVVAVSLLCFFLLFRTREISNALHAVSVILTPFVYGAVIAYILTPVCNRIEQGLIALTHTPPDKGGKLRSLSVVLSLLLALLLLWGLITMVIPQVWHSVVGIANAIPGELAAANARLHDLLESQPELQAYWDEFSSRTSAGIEEWLRNDILPSMGTLIYDLSSQVAVFFGILKNLFLGLLISIYILSSRRQFAAQAKIVLYGMLPGRFARMVEREVRYADRMFNGFLMGKLLDSAIVGVICFAVTALLRFESAALISVVVGVTNIIPFFGPFLGAIPCAILLLLENPMHCVYFLIFIVILQQLDGNVIGPRILGNTTGLSSFWVMFAILLFGGLWGIVGMVVGVPLFAVIYDIVRQLTLYGLRRHERGDLIEAYDREFHPEVEALAHAQAQEGKSGAAN